MVDRQVCRGKKVPAQGRNPVSLGIVEKEVNQAIVGDPRTVVGNIDVGDQELAVGHADGWPVGYAYSQIAVVPRGMECLMSNTAPKPPGESAGATVGTYALVAEYVEEEK